jgi:hypothetical protein
MLIKVFLATLLLLSMGPICFQVPQSASEKGYEPTRYVIDQLFNSPKTESDDESRLVWTPDSEEEALFNISYDGLCHTRLDTILNFEDISIYVFKTQTYDKAGNIVGCHFCPADISVAVLRHIVDSPEVICSQKHLTDSGLFGGEGKEGVGVFSVVKIERNAFLSLKRPVAGNNGFNVGVCDLYFIDNDLPHAFSYEYYSEANGKTIKRNLNLEKSSRSRIVTNSSDGVETWQSDISIPQGQLFD